MNVPSLQTGDASPPDAPPRSTSRRLTVLYVFALSTVAVLSIGAQWLIQKQLSDGESDSRVINLAGRQRMLSQRLAKSSLRLAAYPEDADSLNRRELAETLGTWADNHRALQDGDSSSGLPGNNSREVRSLFASIEDDFNAMRSAAARLLAESAAANKRDVEIIQSHEQAFLQGMDRIVFQLVAEAEHRAVWLRKLEWTILVLTLFVLLAEGLLIFRPAARRIEQTVARLSALSENLRRSRDEAEEANAAKSRFLANVSHELRTPMTAVLGMTELAQRAESPEERQRYLQIVGESGESLLGLLNDLIDLSQIDADALELRSEPFSPLESVRRVVRMLEPTCQAKGVRLESELPDRDLTLLGDARRVEQVLINLVANAIKWTDAGEVRVRCESLRQGDRVNLTLAVCDTGVGIAGEEQQRVFAPFAQAERHGASRGGVGLGLAICQRLTHAMGGRIGLRSDLGSGTTVTLRVELPVATATGEPVEPASLIAEPTAALNVLVVEDAEVNQLLFTKLLEADGHSVEVAPSGEEALRLASAAEYDVVLVDYQLPGMDGVETAKRLAASAAARAGARPRLICVSAHAALPDDNLPRGLFDAFLPKPVSSRELYAALRKVSPADLGPAGDESEKPLTQELAEVFLTVLEPQSDQLSNAVVRGDLAQVAILAHRIRGQVGYFDAERLTHSLTRLETSCRQGAVEEARRLAASVREGLSELGRRLEPLVGEESAPG